LTCVDIDPVPIGPEDHCTYFAHRPVWRFGARTGQSEVQTGADRKGPAVAELDELALTIARHLEIDWQYVKHVEAWDTEQIAAIRSAGRRAGRHLGYKIMTHQSDPSRREDGRVVVIVAVRETPNPEDGERMKERSRLLINDAFKELRQGSNEQE
jgi:hypothetical protein